MIIDNLNFYITEYLQNLKAILHVKCLVAPPKQLLKGHERAGRFL